MVQTRYFFRSQQNISLEFVASRDVAAGGGLKGECAVGNGIKSGSRARNDSTTRGTLPRVQPGMAPHLDAAKREVHSAFGIRAFPRRRRTRPRGNVRFRRAGQRSGSYDNHEMQPRHFPLINLIPTQRREKIFAGHHLDLSPLFLCIGQRGTARIRNRWECHPPERRAKYIGAPIFFQYPRLAHVHLNNTLRFRHWRETTRVLPSSLLPANALTLTIFRSLERQPPCRV